MWWWTWARTTPRCSSPGSWTTWRCTRPGQSQALSTGIHSPTPARGPPSPGPLEPKPHGRELAGPPELPGTPTPSPRLPEGLLPLAPAGGRSGSRGACGGTTARRGLGEAGRGGRGGRKVHRPHGKGDSQERGQHPSVSGHACCAHSPCRAGSQPEPGACRGWAGSTAGPRPLPGGSGGLD